MAEKSANPLAVAAQSLRPTVVGLHQAVSTGHYLATLAAMRVLDRGGNAIDAGVTAAIALAVLQPDIVSFAGVAPTLVYLKDEDRVVSLAGLGWWPAATDVSRLIREGTGNSVPEGILRTVLPAAPATHIEALRRWGTISFEQAATPAMELARDGFATYPLLASNIEALAEGFGRWPGNRAVFLARGRPPRVGELFRQEDLARTFTRMIQAERDARGDRDARLRAVHDCFYRGPIAVAIADYHAKEGGFVTLADLASFEVPVEDSITADYRGYRVHSCDVWCQGIVLLQSLKILEGFDLVAMGHNSPQYVHTVTESLNLAFADREAYVGDPKFVEVPREAMLSGTYAARQRSRIMPDRAFGRMPEAGNPDGRSAQDRAAPEEAYSAPRGREARLLQGTIHGCVVDRAGNAYAGTLSDTTHDTPFIPGTGLAISSRGQQSRLEPGHPAEVRPGKRPRLTPSPALAFRDGKLFMAFGTPGGDVQSQAMLQVFVNVADHGMTMQQAVEAPRFSSLSFPNSFAPHEYLPGRLNLECTMPVGVIEEMRALGHDVEIWPAYPAANAAVCAIKVDPQTGLRHAGADPRRECYALAW